MWNLVINQVWWKEDQLFRIVVLASDAPHLFDNDSVLQEVQSKTRLVCLIRSQMLTCLDRIVQRKLSCKDELKGTESLENPGPNGLTK